MENASKALIIAGAILLAIAIIGVGMFVYNNVSDTITGAADMSKQEIAAYNQDFTAYQGRCRGSRAKTLCEAIKNHNLSAIDYSQKIILTYGQGITDQNDCPPPSSDTAAGTTTAEIDTIRNTNIQSGQTYTVTCGYDKNSGLVTTVDISPAS